MPVVRAPAPLGGQSQCGPLPLRALPLEPRPLRPLQHQPDAVQVSRQHRQPHHALEAVRAPRSHPPQAALLQVVDRRFHRRVRPPRRAERRRPLPLPTALLDCPYFHVVFTLPREIAAIALQNRRALYNLLFRAAARTLREIAADPQHLGAEIGFFAVLHTWGSNLSFHPHLHCVVPGGGIAPDGDRWIPCRPGFFLPVRVLSRRFRTLFLDQLERAFRHGRLRLSGALAPLADPAAFHSYLRPLRGSEWVVYSKPPFDGPARVLDYVGRYTHRVALSNDRILAVADGRVRFRWRDYRHGRRLRSMTLSAEEFMRRFLLHVLPRGFHRIRHCGFLASCHRQQKLALCRQLLGMPPREAPPAPPPDYRDRYEKLTGDPLWQCPACRRGRMLVIETLEPAAEPPPPDDTS